MTEPEPSRIDFYWRPRCGFCVRLKRQIDQRGLTVDEHNIWNDHQAAAHVRSVDNGNETVPTITVGDQSLVNPSIGDLVELLNRSAPHLLPEGHDTLE